ERNARTTIRRGAETRRTRGRQATKEWLLRAGERLARSRTRRSFLPRLGESTVVAEIRARLPAPGERVSVPSRLSPRRRSLRRAHRSGALRSRPFGLPAAATSIAALPTPAWWEWLWNLRYRGSPCPAPRGPAMRWTEGIGATWPRALARVLSSRLLSRRLLSRRLAYVPSDHSRDVEELGDLKPKRGKRPVRAGVLAEDFRRRLLLLERLSVRIDRNDLAAFPSSAHKPLMLAAVALVAVGQKISSVARSAIRVRVRMMRLAVREREEPSTDDAAIPVALEDLAPRLLSCGRRSELLRHRAPLAEANRAPKS